MGHPHAAVTLAENALYRRLVRVFARHAEQTRGLANDHDGLVFIDGLQLFAQVDGTGAFLYVQTFKHVGQDGLAFAPAGGVISQMVAHLATGRFAIPELSDLQGLQPMLVGILQQLGSAAVARAAWGQGEALLQSGRRVIGAPDLDEVFALTTGIEHSVLGEEPLLQGLGEGLALALQGRYARRRTVGNGGLAVEGARRRTVGNGGCFEGGGYLAVKGCDASLGLLEMAVGLLGIENGRDEERPVVAAC